jgi:GNAT superfamily N-acetyltransferase
VAGATVHSAVRSDAGVELAVDRAAGVESGDAAAYGWSTFPEMSVGVPIDAGASPWDSTIRQGIAAPRDSDVRDIAHYDRMLDDAKRADDFVRWVLGPPSMPQAAQTNDAALGRVSPKDIGVGARDAVSTGGDARPLLVDNSAAPVVTSQMSTPGPDGAGNSAPKPNEAAGATYNPLTWTAADNPLSWIQQQYERQYPERAAAMKRMADTRLGDVPSIDAPNAARRMADGFAFGYGNEPTIPYQNIGPDTTTVADGHALPDWAQPDAKFLWRSPNVAPQLLDVMLRGVRGGVYGAAGGIAGLYQDLGGSEAWADRLQRDLGILAQYLPTDLSLVRPVAPEPRAPARALEQNPRDIAPLADRGAPVSAPRSPTGPKAALDLGALQYTPAQADLIRDWLRIAPERFRGTVRLDPPLIDGDILDARGELMGHINRSISRDTGVAEHGLMLLLSDLQGRGLAKDILRANINYYRKLGLSRANVSALDRGGYVWARYGFLPTQESWDAVRPMLRDRVTDPSLNIAPAVRRDVLHLLDSHDPHAIWRIADKRTPVTIEAETLPLGTHLLSGSDWEGSLDLKDAPTMERFYDYARSNR